MNRMQKSVVTMLATAALGLAASPAFAANAYVLKDSVVRKTPTSNGLVVNNVTEGDEITVTDCQGNYCLVQIPGPDGWLRQDRIGALDSGGSPNPKIPFNFSFGIGSNGKPSISIGVGNGPKPPPVVVPEADEVCFYRNANFKGPSFCVEPGDSDDLTGPWNDSISSIEISGDASVTVCRNAGLSGACADYTSSRATLSSTFDNRISSYEVY